MFFDFSQWDISFFKDNYQVALTVLWVTMAFVVRVLLKLTVRDNKKMEKDSKRQQVNIKRMCHFMRCI